VRRRDNNLVVKSVFYEYAYQFLKKVDFLLLNRGSTQPLITQSDLKKLPIYLPNIDTLNSFERQANTIMLCYNNNLKEIRNLKQIKKVMIIALAHN